MEMMVMLLVKEDFKKLKKEFYLNDVEMLIFFSFAFSFFCFCLYLLPYRVAF